MKRSSYGDGKVNFKTKEHKPKSNPGEAVSYTKAHENKIGVKASGFGHPSK